MSELACLTFGVLGALPTDVSWNDIKAILHGVTLSQANLTLSQTNLTRSQARTEESIRSLTEAVGQLNRFRSSGSIDEEMDLTEVVADEVRAREMTIVSIMESWTLYRRRKRDSGVEWDGYIFCRNCSLPAGMTVFVIEAKSRVTDTAVDKIGDRVARTVQIFREAKEWDRTNRTTQGVSEVFQEQATRLLSVIGDCEDVDVKPCIGFFRGNRSKDLEERAGNQGIVTVRKGVTNICTVRFPFRVRDAVSEK
jgi:hypothetical protein